MGSLLVTIFVILVIAYLGLGIILYFMQPSFLFGPVKEIPYTPAELGLNYEKVRFAANDGAQISGWFIPSPNSEFTLLFCHGNGGNMMHCLDSINLFYNLGLSCLIFDYRGYGKSEGKTTEEGTYLDAEAAYKWLTGKKAIPSEKIMFFGRSLGGSIAAYLAGKVPAKSLVVESTFTSYVNIGKKFYPYMPVKLFASFNYNTIEYIKNVHCPVMIVHSRNDEVIPFEFGLELYQAAHEPKEFVEITGTHNDGFLISREVYMDTWKKWLKKLQDSKNKKHQTG